MATLCARYGVSRETGDIRLARHAASPRPYPARFPPLEHPGHFLEKRAAGAGTIRFEVRLRFLASAVEQHRVGLEETADAVWSFHLGRVLMSRVGERTMTVYGRVTPTECYPSCRNTGLPVIPPARLAPLRHRHRGSGPHRSRARGVRRVRQPRP